MLWRAVLSNTPGAHQISSNHRPPIPWLIGKGWHPRKRKSFDCGAESRPRVRLGHAFCRGILQTIDSGYAWNSIERVIDLPVVIIDDSGRRSAHLGFSLNVGPP